MRGPNSSTMTLPTARTILSGRMEGDGYVIVLDGPQEVETRSEELAAAIAKAKTAGRQITVELEPSKTGGRPTIIEAQILAAEADVSTTRPATTPPAKAAAPSTSQALVKAPAIPQGLIVRPDELAEQMQAMSQHYNVLSPAIAISQFAPGFGANLAVVKIDPTVTMDDKGNGSGPDCYFSASIHKERNKRSLNKNGLQKIAQALGIQWDERACRRLDDGKERNYWLWKYVGYVRTHDGQLQTVEGTRELDLRDGSAEAADMKSPAQLQKQRAMGNQMAETKAMQRAIRTFVQQVYTIEQLQKPFLIVRFSFTPDMADPEIKKLVTERALGGIGTLYAPPATPALPPVSDDVDDALPTVSTQAPAKPAPAGKVDPFAEAGTSNGTTPAAAVPEGARFIAEVKVAGTGKKHNGAPWTRYQIVATTGEIWSTFSDTHYKDALEAKTKGWPVRVVDEENEKYPDQRDLKTLTLLDPRQGTLPMEERY
jgi:hypothetical protein